MNTELSYPTGRFLAVLHRISKEIVEEVPAEIALCEFDCSKTHCSSKEWETCTRRLRKPAKKLMPLARSASAAPAA